jgi:predicted AAA+ superfamily ATPase
LFGPRGTGKSIFLKQRFSEALWIDLLKPENLHLYNAYPERLTENIAANHHTDIVIDEVQRSPQILNVVHSLIEQNKKFTLL